MLIRTALRLCACEAIGKIGIACDVRDSQIAAFDTLSVPEVDQPFVAIYTDQDQKLTIVIGITKGAGKQTADGNNQVVDTGGAEIPVTDAGMELLLDVIEWQVRQALSNEDCPWAAWLMAYGAPDLAGATSTRGAMRDKETNEPFAGREIIVPLNATVRDPHISEDISDLTHWAAFLELLGQVPEYGDYLSLFQQIFGNGIEDWRTLYRTNHLHSGTMSAFGLTPTD